LRPYVNSWLDKGPDRWVRLCCYEELQPRLLKSNLKLIPNLSLRRKIYMVIGDEIQLI